MMDEFYDARSALARQRPPLLALEGSEAKLELKQLRLEREDADVGVGAIVIDCGTGEFKVLALLQFKRVVVYELGLMKWANIDKDKFEKVQDVVQQDVGHPLDERLMGAAFRRAAEAVTVCNGGCSRMWQRLQPYAMEAVAVCNGGCSRMQWRL